MAEPSARPVRSLLVPLQGGRMLLLPNAAVAEVVALVGLEAPAEGAPAWRLGTLGWRGQSLQVVAFEGLGGDVVARPARGAQLIVVNAVGAAAALGYYGLVAAGIPHLMVVREGAAQTRAVPGEGGCALADIVLGEVPATIPDLEAIEATLAGVA